MARSDEAEDRCAGLYDAPATGPLSGLSPDQVENRLLRAVLDDLKAGGSLPGLTSNRSKAELGERLRRETGLPLRPIARFLGICFLSIRSDQNQFLVNINTAAAPATEPLERESPSTVGWPMAFSGSPCPFSAPSPASFSRTPRIVLPKTSSAPSTESRSLRRAVLDGFTLLSEAAWERTLSPLWPRNPLVLNLEGQCLLVVSLMFKARSVPTSTLSGFSKLKIKRV